MTKLRSRTLPQPFSAQPLSWISKKLLRVDGVIEKGQRKEKEEGNRTLYLQGQVLGSMEAHWVFPKGPG